MIRNLPRALCESRAKWEFIHDIAEECKDHFHYEMSLKVLNDLLEQAGTVCGFCKEADGFPDGPMWALRCGDCFLGEHIAHTNNLNDGYVSCLHLIPGHPAEDSDCNLYDEFKKLVELSNFMLETFDKIEEENK